MSHDADHAHECATVCHGGYSRLVRNWIPCEAMWAFVLGSAWLLGQAAISIAPAIAPGFAYLLLRPGRRPASSLAAVALLGGYLTEVVLGLVVVRFGVAPGVAWGGVSLLTAAAIAAWLSRGRGSTRGTVAVRDLVWLAVAAAALLLPRCFFQALVGQWPRGWDPSFHLAVVRAMTGNHLLPPSLEPFEPVGVVYPIGSHLAVIGQSLLGAVEPHVAFSVHNAFTAGLMSLVAVASFTERWTKRARIGLLAMVVYGGAVHFGSADYLNWGGLPNQVGMAVLLIGISARTWALDRVGRIGGIVVCGVSFLFNQHVMMCAIAFIGAHVVFDCIATRTVRPILVGIGEILVSATAAAPVTVPLALKVGDVWARVSDWNEVYDWLTLWTLAPGSIALVLGVVGICIVSLRGPARRDLLPIAMVSSLVLMFGVTCGGWRFVTTIVNGTPSMAVTPSRFVTNLAYPLSAFGGLALAAALDRIRSAPEARPRRLRMAAWALVLLPIVVGEQWLWLRAKIVLTLPSAERLAALTQVRALLPQNAVAAPVILEAEWGPYVLATECTMTARPISEPSTDYSKAKRRLHEMLRERRPCAKEAAEIFGARPVIVISDVALPEFVTPIATVGPLYVGRLDP